MRIIIDNRSSLSDAEAVDRVHQHMRQPSQVEDREYLAAAMYYDRILVWHGENKRSHRFVVCDYPRREK